MMQKKTVFLGSPLGMCAGVRRALETVEAVLERFGAPIYVLHEIVHNNFIVNDLRQRGVCFAESIDEIPPESVLLFSAHGVSAAVEREARRRKLRIIDVTCPLVKKLHHSAEKASGILILIGHRGHPEVEGTVGRSGAGQTFVVGSESEAEALPPFPPETRIELLAQTTLNTEDVKKMEERLRERYPQLESAAAVCYATTNRQKAMRALAKKCDVVLIVGSPHSSNSNRLREVAEQEGARAFLIENAGEIPPEAIEDTATIGVGAGASAPEALVTGVLDRLRTCGFRVQEERFAVNEDTKFSIPPIPEKP